MIQWADDCEIWQGSTRGRGYGQVWCPDRKRQIGAHVRAWEKAHGERVPEGMVITHTCGVKRCVNPAHLRLAEQRQPYNERDRFGRYRRREP